MNINFLDLQGLFNQQMSLLLSSSGLTTKCQFNFGVSKKNICSNCIYDPNLKKSSNKYKTGGPVPFGSGKICPYCNGIGFYGETNTEDAHLAIIWDYKKWINPPTNIATFDGMIQTISDKKLLFSIRQCKDMTVIVNPDLSNPTFVLYSEPNFAGLGDNNYIFCMWQKTGTKNAV